MLSEVHRNEHNDHFTKAHSYLIRKNTFEMQLNMYGWVICPPRITCYPTLLYLSATGPAYNALRSSPCFRLPCSFFQISGLLIDC